MPGTKEFVNKSHGLTVSVPPEKAQHFICCPLRLYPAQLMEFLAKHADEEMLKIDVKIYDGKNPDAPPLYLEVNRYKSDKPAEGASPF